MTEVTERDATIGGGTLMALVEAYDALGTHRTGGPADRATAEWLTGEVQRLGGRAGIRPYPFDRFVAEWDVRVDGEPVEALPVWYSFEGRLRGARSAVVSAALDSAAAEHQAIVGEEALLAGAAGQEGAGDEGLGQEVVVVATEHPAGHLVAPNRVPGSATAVPVVCVAGSVAGDGAHEAPTATVDAVAQVRPGTAWNVHARLGDAPDPQRVESSPLLIVTPTSGWFRCAGERGTGIAVALAVAHAVVERTDGRVPVELLATSGHEIGHLGALAAEPLAPRRPAAILHVGASVAARAGPGRPELTPHLVARANVTGGRTTELDRALAPLGVRARVPDRPENPSAWVGEARRWAARKRPLLSLAGWFPEFHTPADRPAVTSPDLLAATANALADAALVLLDPG